MLDLQGWCSRSYCTGRASIQSWSKLEAGSTVNSGCEPGVLEQGTVELLTEMGVGERMKREGLVHNGVEVRVNGCGHRIDFQDLTGRSITIYAQQEVVKDLIAARLEAGARIFFESEDVSVHDFDSAEPKIRFRDHGEPSEILCDFIAGCDGFHGVCRPSIADALTLHERIFPFAWLGILAAAPPSSEELIYCYHERGFALHSMRTPEITRLYLQCAPDEDLALWPDERIWQELQRRLSTRDGSKLTEGPVLQKGVTGMRSFVAEPMQHGRLISGRGRSPHCASDRSQGTQSGGGGCPHSRRSDGGILSCEQDRTARSLLGEVLAASLAGPALLAVDDHHAAPVSWRRSI